MLETTTADTSDTSTHFVERRRTLRQRAQQLLHTYPYISPLVLLILTMVIFSVLNPRFATPNSLSLLLQQTAITAALGIGQTLIILTAGIDLSVGAITVLSMMFMATLASQNGVPGPVAIVIGVVVGMVGGLFNGLLVTRLNLPPFIVTLGSLSIWTAIALLFSGGSTIINDEMPDALNFMGEGFRLGPFFLTMGVIATVIMYLVVGFALSQTAWGLHVYAVGDDPEAARLAGIDKKLLISVYVLAGLIYGITAWILIGRTGAATPNAIGSANLESITAVVIGGTSLFGGRGRLIGTLFGALIVQAFNFGLSLAGVNQQWQVLAIGVLVIVAVAVDQWIRKVRS
jgi:fructose transport system permease protein